MKNRILLEDINDVVRELNNMDMRINITLMSDDGTIVNLLDGVFDMIDKEKKKLIKEATSFFNLPPSDNNKNAPPYQIFILMKEYVIRIKRLCFVYNPFYYKCVSPNKPQGKIYDMAKLVWINGNNIRYRRKTTTFGPAGKEGMEITLKKILDILMETDKNDINSYYTDKKNTHINKNGFDLIVKVGNVIYKLYSYLNKEDLITLLIMLYNWKLYENTYLINDIDIPL